jgi:hypothetical protein
MASDSNTPQDAGPMQTPQPLPDRDRRQSADQNADEEVFREPNRRALGTRISATFASAFADLGKTKNSASTTPPPTGTHAQSFQLQRKNLIHLLQLCVQRLVETGVQLCHQLDDSHEALSQFCVVMDHVMRHGLKGVDY